MDETSANPASGSEVDPVSLIEEQLEREVNPTPTKRPRSDAAPETPDQEEPAEELPPGEDGEQTEDPEPDEDEEQSDEQPPEQTEEVYTVKAGGAELQVTKDELIRGYQRLSDYSRNIQAVADQRKQVEAEQARIAHERAHYAQQLEQVATVLTAALPPEPDWDRLSQEDPIGYIQTQRQWQSQMGRLQHVLGEQQRVQQIQQEHSQQAQQQMLARAAEQLVELLPEWRDPAKAKTEKRQVADYLRNLGYADEEIASAGDPRAIAMAKKAMAWDRLQASKTSIQQKVAAAPRMVKPGSAGPAPNKSKQLAQRLKQSGGRDLDAAAALIEMG